MDFLRGSDGEQQASGLRAVSRGFNGFSALKIHDGMAHMYLIGECASNGATYTVAQPILANLLQLPEIRFVKIYYVSGSTEDPMGESHSIPWCLEP